jgi:transposase
MCQGGDSQAIPFTKEATTMKITTIGLDLAKNIFQLHGVDERGRVVLKKQLKRARVLPFFAQMEPCLVAMESCSSAHHSIRSTSLSG